MTKLLSYLSLIFLIPFVSSTPWPDCTHTSNDVAICRPQSLIVDNQLNFLVLGDTGGINLPPYYTSAQKVGSDLF